MRPAWSFMAATALRLISGTIMSVKGSFRSKWLPQSGVVPWHHAMATSPNPVRYFDSSPE